MEDWNRAIAAEQEREAHARLNSTGFAKMALDPITAVSVALNVVTSVASLFKVDTSTAGAAVTAGEQQIAAMIAEALAARGFNVDAEILSIAGEPRRVRAEMEGLHEPYSRASARYHAEYLPRLAKADKLANLNAGIALAGKQLELAIAEYENLQKAVYTPVNGVLPATVLERQAALAENRNRPIVYIRSHRAALTTTTRKGFLTTLGGSVPIHMNAAAELDYLLYDGRIEIGSVLCTTGRARITAIGSASTTCEGPMPLDKVVASRTASATAAAGSN